MEGGRSECDCCFYGVGRFIDAVPAGVDKRESWRTIGGLLAELARLVETVGLVCILRRLGTGCN